MAKYVNYFNGNFDHFVQYLAEDVKQQSVSATLEDREDFRMGDVRCSVLVLERYRRSGGNRCSMNITILGNQDEIRLTAITSGGSQGMFFKVNTLGEESFLDTIKGSVEKYLRNNQHY